MSPQEWEAQGLRKLPESVLELMAMAIWSAHACQAAALGNKADSSCLIEAPANTPNSRKWTAGLARNGSEVCLPRAQLLGLPQWKPLPKTVLFQQAMAVVVVVIVGQVHSAAATSVESLPAGGAVMAATETGVALVVRLEAALECPAPVDAQVVSPVVSTPQVYPKAALSLSSFSPVLASLDMNLPQCRGPQHCKAALVSIALLVAEEPSQLASAVLGPREIEQASCAPTSNAAAREPWSLQALWLSILLPREPPGK
mmetsp:Transcript_30366/g.69891  ORF Transcript_30366/g.69891 Transcript_30366/m.69891 type:complete len:257 (-) Transcript_30366:331-1101(-)